MKSICIYEVSKPSFEALLVDFNNSEKGHQLYNTILQHIAIYKDEYSMLKKIALAPEKYRTVDHRDISLIDHIEKYGLIEYDKSTLFVTFNIQSIQDYIQKTSDKNPKDMNNDERRQYVQDRVSICEKKLKRYILNYYTYNGSEAAGKTVLTSFMSGTHPSISINPNASPIPNPSSCKLKDFFDHSKFIFFFSSIKKIISSNWSTLGTAFISSGISKDKFNVCRQTSIYGF